MILNKYKEFLKNLDAQLDVYFNMQSEHICCKKGCSYCCEKGDYPISEIELRYIMQGYLALDLDKKIKIQQNVKSMQKSGACPFLLNNECSIYLYRPIICRVHGLAYLCKEKTVKLPYCVNLGLNFSNVYKDNEFLSEPILENLDSQNLLKDFKFGEIRNLYDWIIGNI